MKYLFYILLIGTGLGIGLWLDGCEGDTVGEAEVYDTGKRKPDPKGHELLSDDVVFPWLIKQGKDSVVYRDTGSYVVKRDTIYKGKDIDTQALIRDYFRQRKGQLTWEDSLIKAKLQYLIWRNKLAEHEFEYQFKEPMTKASNLKKNNYSRLYGGAIIGGNEQSFIYGPQLIYTRERWAGNAMYNIPGKAVMVGGSLYITDF